MMIGRAAIGYPWIFNEIKHYLQTGEILAPPIMKDRLEAAKNHLIWSMEWKGERLGIVEMRRHYTNYFKGIHGFKVHRQRLVTEDSPEQLLKIFDEIEDFYKDFAIEHIKEKRTGEVRFFLFFLFRCFINNTDWSCCKRIDKSTVVNSVFYNVLQFKVQCSIVCFGCPCPYC